ncbi:hypothetical protein HaLaN_29751, partial [Haematococcus lacustris]
MMLIGSGLEGLGGTALIYRSPDLAAATAALANGYGGGTAAEAWALARAVSGMESAHSISDQSVELISQVIVRQPVTDVLAATDPTEHNGREPEQEALHSVLHSVSSLHQYDLETSSGPYKLDLGNVL